MSHSALIALMNNQSLSLTPSVDEFVTDFIELSIYYINNLFIDLSKKYMETFGNKHYLAISSFFIIIYAGISIAEHYTYLVRIKENEDQIQYLKKKNRILEGNIEFLLDNNAINELKIIKLTKQMKKLQKEVNEYA
jgi:hypothetical protein